MTRYKGKGVYGAVAAGKIKVLKRQDMQVKRVRTESPETELKRLAAAKEKGLVKSEGKEYVMKDGDIVHFLFNV